MQKEIDKNNRNHHKNDPKQQDSLEKLYKNFEDTDLNDQKLSNVEGFKILRNKAKEDITELGEAGEALMYKALAEKTEEYLKLFDDVELTKGSTGSEYIKQMQNIEQQATDPEYISSMQKQHEDVFRMAEINQESISKETKAIFERFDTEMLGMQKQEDEQEVH